MSRERMEELVNLAAPFWAGEAEIVRAYCERLRSVDRDLFWLRAQAFKETWHLRLLPPDQQEEYWQHGTVANHPEGAEGVARLDEEMKHFRLIAELIETRLGRPIRRDDMLELPEETRLQDLRAPWRAGNVLERLVVDFTEGGGGAMCLALARLDGNDFDRRVAAAFQTIHDDEIHHGPGQIHLVARNAHSDADWEHSQEIVLAVGVQRLRMRNEMFSFPLTPERLTEIGTGQIEPWPMPIEI